MYRVLHAVIGFFFLLSGERKTVSIVTPWDHPLFPVLYVYEGPKDFWICICSKEQREEWRALSSNLQQPKLARDETPSKRREKLALHTRPMGPS